jgi:hypothetical protein
MSEARNPIVLACIEAGSQNKDIVELVVLSLLQQAFENAGPDFNNSFDDLSVQFDGTYCVITFTVNETKKDFRIDPIIDTVVIVEVFVASVAEKNKDWVKSFESVVWTVDKEIRKVGFNCKP